MRFSVLTSLAFIGTTIAAPSVELQKRQEISNINFVLDGYKGILTNAHKLIEKVTKLKEGDDVIAALKEMSGLSGETIKITEGMIANINSTPGKMTSQAVLQVSKPSLEVAQTTMTIIDTLVSKKQIFVKAKVHQIVLEDLHHLYKVSDLYVTAAKSKIPEQYATIANKYLGQLLEALNKGIDNFSKV
jgi:hypothetical protein